MENNENGLSHITDTLETVLTGIPAPVRKNFFKAFSQLCTAAVDIPVSWLEGKSSEIRATTAARVKIINKEGDNISEKIEVPNAYLEKASSKFASKIIKEQINLDEITINASKELIKSEIQDDEAEPKEISEDWLNEFESIARLKSSEEMKFIFGKILSGEIIQPGKFSVKTVKTLAELDNEAARLFQILCGNAVSLRFRADWLYDARVVSLEGTAGSNSLSKYGLPFRSLTILEEYGLIISDFNSWSDYQSCIVSEQNKVSSTIKFQGKIYGLLKIDKEKPVNEVKFSGVSLTKVGLELLDIIEVRSSDIYRKDFENYLKNKNLQILEIK